MKNICEFNNKCKRCTDDCADTYCARKYRLECLFNQSQLTPTQRQYKQLFTDQDGTDRNEFIQLASIENGIQKFVNEGYNLFLHSYICGNGKTSWAIRLLSSYFYKIWPQSTYGCQGLFVSVPRYLLALKENISGHSEYADFINQHILEADIVVWDDIAAKAGTEFELNHLFNLINTRIDSGKSNIFTSNLGKRELAAALGERLASRICNKSMEIELRGSDKRYLGLFNGGENQ